MFKVAKLFLLFTTIIFSFNKAAYSYSQLNQTLLTKSSTQLIDDLKYLTQVIGGRPTGSSAMDDATQWALKRFVAAGFENTRLDAYTPEFNWQANIESGQMIVNTNQMSQLKIAAMPFSNSTSINGLQAPIYAITATDANEIIAHADQIKGRWLLVPTTPMRTMDDLFKEYLHTPSIFSAAKKADAMGILWMSNREGNLLYRHNASLNSKLTDLPAAVIERQGAEQIIQLLQSSQSVNFQATLINTVQDKPRNFNIIAEIKGSEKPDEVIVLGAHLDSWDLGQGAQDNGCNAALVIEAARRMIMLDKQGEHPRRTIRFMLYSGEELGFYGSTFDVMNHLKEMEKVKVVVIVDLGSGKITGFSLGGRKDMQSLTDNMLAPINNNLGPFVNTTDAAIGTDNFGYLLEGIPTLVANQDAKNYLPSYHAENDRFENVDLEQLQINTKITSMLIWNLANTNQSIPARQNQKTVRQLLTITGLKLQMKIFGLWNTFLELEKMGR